MRRCDDSSALMSVLTSTCSLLPPHHPAAAVSPSHAAAAATPTFDTSHMDQTNTHADRKLLEKFGSEFGFRLADPYADTSVLPEVHDANVEGMMKCLSSHLAAPGLKHIVRVVWYQGHGFQNEEHRGDW